MFEILTEERHIITTINTLKLNATEIILSLEHSHLRNEALHIGHQRLFSDDLFKTIRRQHRQQLVVVTLRKTEYLEM